MCQGSHHQGKNLENLENGKSIFQTWKNQGIWKKGQNQGKIRELKIPSGKIRKKFSAPHTLYPSCDEAVHEFCLIVSGETVAIRGGMEATFKNKNDVFLVGDGSFLLHVNAGNSWNILEKSWKNQEIWFWKSGGNPDFKYMLFSTFAINKDIN